MQKPLNHPSELGGEVCKELPLCLTTEDAQAGSMCYDGRWPHFDPGSSSGGAGLSDTMPGSSLGSAAGAPGGTAEGPIE